MHRHIFRTDFTVSVLNIGLNSINVVKVYLKHKRSLGNNISNNACGFLGVKSSDYVDKERSSHLWSDHEFQIERGRSSLIRSLLSARTGRLCVRTGGRSSPSLNASGHSRPSRRPCAASLPALPQSYPLLPSARTRRRRRVPDTEPSLRRRTSRVWDDARLNPEIPNQRIYSRDFLFMFFCSSVARMLFLLLKYIVIPASDTR